MQNEPLADHPLVRDLAQIMGDVIQETTEVRGAKIVQVRDYLPHEEYGREVLLAAGEVQAILKQLVQTAVFLTGFRSTQLLKEHGINRFDHIVYHLENFFIRIVGCFDRCLVLVNVALDLGNEPEDCSYRLIKKNKHIERSGLLGPLGEIHGIVKPYKEERDVVAHRQRYSEPDLRTVEMLHLVAKEEPDAVRGYLVKLQTDRTILAKKKEMNGVNRRLQVAVGRLFGALKPEVEKRYELLKSAV